MLHKYRALRAVYVSMAQAVDMYTNHLRKRGKNSPSFIWGMNRHTFKLMERANRVHL